MAHIQPSYAPSASLPRKDRTLITSPPAGLIENIPPLTRMLSNSSSTEVHRFALSAFHQLHCLKALQTSILHLATAGNKALPQNVALSQIKHANHCFDYLRHSITCAGDMTLEVPKSGGEMLPMWAGATHVCRNWGEVAGWQAEHYSPML